MPEVHFIGEIAGATKFDKQNLFCQWKIITDESGSWDLVRGDATGQTHVDSGVDMFSFKRPDELDIVWSHPIDAQYASSSIISWPKLYVEVWQNDIDQRNEIVGYGFCHLPAAQGQFSLDIVTWKPKGSWYEEMSASFIGGQPQLKDPAVAYSCSNRFDLRARSAGIVHLNIQIMHREFTSRGVVVDNSQDEDDNDNNSAP